MKQLNLSNFVFHIREESEAQKGWVLLQQHVNKGGAKAQDASLLHLHQTTPHHYLVSDVQEW